MSRISIVVVSFNTKSQLRRCLSAVQSSCAGTDFEIIVVDNASKDGSPEMVASEFPDVRLIQNDSNRGFGRANNQGMDASDGDLVLILNSDAYAIGPAIPRLAEVFADRTVVAAGGKLLHPNGDLQESCANALTLWVVFCEQLFLERLFPKSTFLSPYWMSSRLPTGGPVEQVMGACVMVRPAERFDERFFLYCEDTDLCKRMRTRGKILYVPDAEFTHELGSSSSADRWRSVARYNHGKELYFQIHHGRFDAVLCWLFDRLGALLRFLVWGLATLFSLGFVARFRRRTALFFRVLFAPVNGPPNPQS